MREEARKLLAWEAIDDEGLALDETQRKQLDEMLKKARRDLRETVWRTYKVIALLDKTNALKKVDLGLVHSSAASDIVGLILDRLRQDGDLETGISPNFLIRNWPPAFKEWSTKSVRDAFYAAPQFPRLTTPDAVKDTIVRGVSNGLLAYVGKTDSGSYRPFNFNQAMMTADVEISDDMFIITKETAEAFLKTKHQSQGGAEQLVVVGGESTEETQQPSQGPVQTTAGTERAEQLTFAWMKWSGEIPPQKWMNFYTKVLSKFASGKDLALRVEFKVAPEDGVSKQRVDETKAALQELGFTDDVETS